MGRRLPRAFFAFLLLSRNAVGTAPGTSNGYSPPQLPPASPPLTPTCEGDPDYTGNGLTCADWVGYACGGFSYGDDFSEQGA